VRPPCQDHDRSALFPARSGARPSPRHVTERDIRPAVDPDGLGTPFRRERSVVSLAGSSKTHPTTAPVVVVAEQWRSVLLVEGRVPSPRSFVRSTAGLSTGSYLQQCADAEDVVQVEFDRWIPHGLDARHRHQQRGKTDRNHRRLRRFPHCRPTRRLRRPGPSDPPIRYVDQLPTPRPTRESPDQGRLHRRRALGADPRPEIATPLRQGTRRGQAPPSGGALPCPTTTERHAHRQQRGRLGIERPTGGPAGERHPNRSPAAAPRGDCTAAKVCLWTRSDAVLALGVRPPWSLRSAQRTRRGGWKTPTRCRTSRTP